MDIIKRQKKKILGFNPTALLCMSPIKIRYSVILRSSVLTCRVIKKFNPFEHIEHRWFLKRYDNSFSHTHTQIFFWKLCLNRCERIESCTALPLHLGLLTSSVSIHRCPRWLSVWNAFTPEIGPSILGRNRVMNGLPTYKYTSVR